MARIEPPSVSEPKSSRSWDIKTETTVVFGGWANVVAVGGVGRPRCTYFGGAVNECLGSERCEGGFREVEWSVELVVGRDEGIATREA